MPLSARECRLKINVVLPLTGGNCRRGKRSEGQDLIVK
jgi:hypothetical protein